MQTRKTRRGLVGSSMQLELELDHTELSPTGLPNPFTQLPWPISFRATVMVPEFIFVYGQGRGRSWGRLGDIH